MVSQDELLDAVADMMAEESIQSLVIAYTDNSGQFKCSWAGGAIQSAGLCMMTGRVISRAVLDGDDNDDE